MKDYTSQLDAVTDIWSQPDKRTRELAHWRDHGRWNDHDRWASIGAGVISRLDRYAAGQQIRLPKGRRAVALEWGPGGGSTVRQLVRRCAVVYGVDVSEPSLDECSRIAAESGSGVFVPIHYSGEPADVVEAITHPVTTVVSTAVPALPH